MVVVTSDRDHGSTEPFPGLSGRRVTQGTATVYYVDLTSARQWISLITELRKNDYDLILVNSVWHLTLALLPAALAYLRVLSGPVVLMPRGELEPGALSQKGRKKRLASPGVRLLYRLSARAIGTTSSSEAGVAARWFPRVPILRTSNTPDPIDFGVPEAPTAALRAVFLSRIHPTKGLLPLIRGLQGARGVIDLAAVGPIEDRAYWADCVSAAGSLPRQVGFEYRGQATRGDVPDVLWNADCLVLLTAGENFGHVIAEALQAGCPVITTPTTPWTEVLRAGGGDIVEDRDDPTEVAEVLDRWAAKSPEQLAASRHLARSAFEEFAANAGPTIVELALRSLQGRR
jgi:glycosyltransferase involved in cell wall biosynthesis